MALLFYSDLGLTTELTTLTTQHDSAGEAKSVRVFLANKDGAFRYEDISITPEDTAKPPDETSWIQLAPDNAGTPGTYSAPGAALTLANISDAAAHPFWVKITTASVGSAQNKTDLRLSASFKEFAV
jgi:hypothetical protein